MARVLGVSCYFHDAAAALVDDGVLVCAAEEERFSRRKHDASFPALAIDFCLRTAAESGRPIDYVAFYEQPSVKLRRVLTTAAAMGKPAEEAFVGSMRISFSFWRVRSSSVSSRRFVAIRSVF